MNKMIVVLMAAVSLTTAGCTTVVRTDTPSSRAIGLGGGESVRVVSDPVAHVTCWLPIGSGIFCMRDLDINK